MHREGSAFSTAALCRVCMFLAYNCSASACLVVVVSPRAVARDAHALSFEPVLLSFERLPMSMFHLWLLEFEHVAQQHLPADAMVRARCALHAWQAARCGPRACCNCDDAYAPTRREALTKYASNALP